MANCARLFFALGLDQGLRDRIVALSQPWRASLRCRWMAPEKLHLTLAFLGDVPFDRFPVLEAIGQSLRLVEPLSVQFDRLELWPRPQVLCLTGETPEPLGGLVAELSRKLAAEGFAVERRPYRPHLTIARHAHRLPTDPSFAPIGWRPRKLDLVESRPELPGAPYDDLKSWCLDVLSD
ncbi:MAG: RNA 2',3'-cyclic phosphodiesterase [Methylococcaceae bacterium]|nr:RNA 2',3'-cyclic phosphodiesterase [Methylococcaceae bacterium]